MKAVAVLLAIALAAASAFGEDGLKLKVVASPALPASDYLKGGGSFEGKLPFEVFRLRRGPENTSLVDEGAAGTAHAAKLVGGHDAAGLIAWPVTLPVGKEVVVSLYVKGSFGLVARPGGGLGYRIVEARGAKQVGVACGYYSPPQGKENEWRKLVSPPVKASGPWFLVIENYYGSGGGLVDEIKVTDATTSLTVTAQSEAGVRDVIVTDDNGVEVFNSGVLGEGRKEFVKTLTVSTGYTYTVSADDYDGDTQLASCP